MKFISTRLAKIIERQLFGKSIKLIDPDDVLVVYMKHPDGTMIEWNAADGYIISMQRKMTEMRAYFFSEINKLENRVFKLEQIKKKKR